MQSTKAYEWVAIGFGFISDWIRKLIDKRFLNQPQSKIMQNQSHYNWKVLNINGKHSKLYHKCKSVSVCSSFTYL